MNSTFAMRMISAALVSFVFIDGALAQDAVEQRITHVTEGLTPALTIRGDSTSRKTLAERMKALNASAVSIAVIHHGTLDWARGFGYTAAGTPVNADTLFQAGSISKPVTALGALSLVKDRNLSLDSDVNASLTGWKIPISAAANGRFVTVRELLSHTAGLSVHGFVGYPRGSSTPTLRQVLDGGAPANNAPIRIETEPGTMAVYSGGGYTVLQQLMIDVSHQRFDDLMQSRVLNPLTMTRSSFSQPLSNGDLRRASLPYKADGKPVPGGPYTYPELAAAGLWSTPTDIAKFVIEVQECAVHAHCAVLDQKLAQEMLHSGLGKRGLGFQIGGSPEHPYFTHTGIDTGYESVLVAYPDTGDGAVIMTNVEGGSALIEEILRSIAEEYQWPDFRATERNVIHVEPTALAALQGRYTAADSADEVQVFVKDGIVYAQGQKGAPVELLPLSKTTFALKTVNSNMIFDADGFLLEKGSSRKRYKRDQAE